ncbi:MAG: hypothetical protein ACLQU5_17315 [Isosphaeraceae bacterium]
MTQTRSKLLTARKTYSLCAARVEAQIKSSNRLTPSLSERIVGIGVACEWTRRAAELEAITFIGNHLNQSPWTPSFIEMMRYGFAWFAINAIYTRDELLHLIGRPMPDKELERFKILFTAAAMPAAVVLARESSLRSILGEQTTPRLPGVAPGTAVTTLHAINEKYVPMNARKRGASAQLLTTAVATGHFGNIDLPTLLYSFRNWSVHGNVLHGSFGGRPRFSLYLEQLLESLAEVHLGTANALLHLL